MPGFRNLRTEEDRHALTISSIRGKFNDTQAPITSLPAEILEEIFEICVSWLYAFPKPKHRLAWTQVCQSWRRISLSSSRLWHRIDLCDDARFADEFLVRSKQTPLSLVTPKGCSPTLKLTTDKLTIHAHRLRSIDVFLAPDEMVQLFHSIGPNLGGLASLSLRIPPPVSSSLSLDIVIPSVRRVNLDGVSVPWESCENLTSLSLRGLSKEYTPSISEIHHILITSPHLQSIRLEGFTPPNNIEILESEFIHLPHLLDFKITTDATTATTLLSRLSLNPTTRLQLHLSLTDDLHTLFPHSGLPHAPNSPHLIPIQTIRISQYSTHFLRTGAQPWSSNPTHALFALSSAAAVGLTRCSANSLTRLCTTHNITTLELNTAVLHDVPTSLLCGLLSCLHNVESLYIAFHSDLEDLFTVLRSIDPITGVPYLPSLNRVGFGRPRDIWWRFAQRWMGDLMVVLRWRREKVGRTLEGVDFWRCGGVSSGPFGFEFGEVRTMEVEGLVGRVGVY